jgi:biopolymer transport protein ExbD
MGTVRRSALVLIAPLGVIACKPTTTTVEIDLPSKIDFTDGFQQSDADAILSKCNAKDIELTVKPDGEIAFAPDPNADYDAAACVLKYIKESGATKFGFVGNEEYVTPEEGQ